MLLPTSPIRIYAVAILTLSFLLQSLLALPLNTDPISDNHSLKPRGTATGVVAGVLGTQLYQEIKEYRDKKRNKQTVKSKSKKVSQEKIEPEVVNDSEV